MTSLTEENYLKAIYNLNSSKGTKASTNAIAAKMETKASSVTDMIKRLNEKNLIVYQKYQPVYLTEEGKKVAISIIRKHRLWEYFLVENLKFGWDEVHDIAEQLEHIQSKELTNRLDKFLDFPRYDPHGDPIPNMNGEFPNRKREKLSNAKKGDNVMVTGVKDDSTEFLNYLKQLKIQLGTTLSIHATNAFDQSISIQTEEGIPISISEKVSNNLFIKSLS
ncbi:MAG: metal-dependent transcriptional regulator [Flavobacteriales bacterium]|nr:metal-dependent transcriptional regulator [Flavobacteriales bacterium]